MVDLPLHYVGIVMVKVIIEVVLMCYLSVVDVNRVGLKQEANNRSCVISSID